MRIRIKVSSYEECRKEFFLNLKKHAENKIKYWERQKGYRCEIEDNLAEAGAEFEYCQDALNALEKQIPKKVVPIQRTAHDFETGVCKHSHYPCEHLKPFNHEYKYTDYKCPVCGKRVSDGKPYSCCHCTQALDWSDTE